MAVTAGYKVDQRFDFFALSNDTLPTTWGGKAIPTGSSLYLADTFQPMVWTGAAWVNSEQEVEENPVYNPLLTAQNDLAVQQIQVLNEILAFQKAILLVLANSSPGASDNLNSVISTLTQ